MIADFKCYNHIQLCTQCEFDMNSLSYECLMCSFTVYSINLSQPVNHTDKPEQIMIHMWMSAVMALIGGTVPHRWQMTEYHQLNDSSVHLD